MACPKGVVPVLEDSMPHWDSLSPSESNKLSRQLYFLKQGPKDLILWEYLMYSRVQRSCGFPIVCQRFYDHGPTADTAAMLLHPVVCIDGLIREYTTCNLPLPFPFRTVAWVASGLLVAMFSMHKDGVLHCDIHPGNIGIAGCSGLEEALLAPGADMEGSGKPTPTFIDFEWSRLHGYHPSLGDDISSGMWTYMSDRVVRQEGPYCKADDVVSLAYCLLALRALGHPPWYQDCVEAWRLCSGDPDSFIESRAQYLRDLGPSGAVESLILDFIAYAESLQPGEVVDYMGWANAFGAAAIKTELGFGDAPGAPLLKRAT